MRADIELRALAFLKGEVERMGAETRPHLFDCGELGILSVAWSKMRLRCHWFDHEEVVQWRHLAPANGYALPVENVTHRKAPHHGRATPIPFPPLNERPTLSKVQKDLVQERDRQTLDLMGKVCTDPDKMHGAADGFGGSDF